MSRYFAGYDPEKWYADRAAEARIREDSVSQNPAPIEDPGVIRSVNEYLRLTRLGTAAMGEVRIDPIEPPSSIL